MNINKISYTVGLGTYTILVDDPLSAKTELAKRLVDQCRNVKPEKELCDMPGH